MQKHTTSYPVSIPNFIEIGWKTKKWETNKVLLKTAPKTAPETAPKTLTHPPSFYGENYWSEWGPWGMRWNCLQNRVTRFAHDNNRSNEIDKIWRYVLFQIPLLMMWFVKYERTEFAHLAFLKLNTMESINTTWNNRMKDISRRSI